MSAMVFVLYIYMYVLQRLFIFLCFGFIVALMASLIYIEVVTAVCFTWKYAYIAIWTPL